MQFDISNEEIRWAETILLPHDGQFDEERRVIIRNMDTKDIQACPGSGKTTALLAKLLILSRRMPLPNNTGICVLTHTNVAINEISRRANKYASILFNYPNHFGTIQSFVDRYLAIPASIERFNKRPSYIDNETFISVIEANLTSLHRARIWLERKLKGQSEGALAYLKDLRFNKDNFCICKRINQGPFVGVGTSTYTEIHRLKLRILEWGYLCYEDTYSLAFEYLRKHPQIRDLIIRRFRYVFIDEMQDSNKLQCELLNKVFGDNVVVQRIGDPNQSIFDSDADQERGWEIGGENTLRINGSKRFSTSIASKVEALGVVRQNIIGISRRNEIAPIMIAYDDVSIKKVLDKFGEIIIRNGLQRLPDNKFKAVGWRGKPHERKITIVNYWTGYSKEVRIRRIEFSTFKSYLLAQPDDFIRSQGVRFYADRIFAGLCKCLRLAGVTDNGRALTRKKLLSRVLESNPMLHRRFMQMLANWCIQIHKKREIQREVISFVVNELGECFRFELNSDLLSFLSNPQASASVEISGEGNSAYIYEEGNNRIKIEVSTIHNVKGETHTATCYLETYYHDYDIKRIINYLSGNYISPANKIIEQNLRMAFVGMSRPSHLLCVATHWDHIAGHKKALMRNGWEINKELIYS
jgi:DNA helicase-2/ATP-dependent DNA helicase PcrA